MIQAPVDRQSRPLGCPLDLNADAPLDAGPPPDSRFLDHAILPCLRACSGRRLAGLAAYVFAFVLDAFSLVRLGGAERTQLCSHLADKLLVDTRHREERGLRNLNLDAAGRLEEDRMRVPEGKLDLLSFHF